MQSNTDTMEELFQLWIQTFDKQVSMTPHKITMDEPACNNIFQFYYDINFQPFLFSIQTAGKQPREKMLLKASIIRDKMIESLDALSS